MRRRDMVDALSLFLADFSDFSFVCFGCMDRLAGWRWVCFLRVEKIRDGNKQLCYGT